MNFCEGGDLYSKLKQQAKLGKALEETQIVEWFVQIAMALQVEDWENSFTVDSLLIRTTYHKTDT